MNDTAMQHVPQDIWKVVAGFLVEKHALRTVYDVAQDLFSLQLVCKNSAQCAASIWPSVAAICAKPHVRAARVPNKSAETLRNHLVKRNAVPELYILEEAMQLPADRLTVFLQVQSDKHAQINHKNATKLFGLTYKELCQVQKPAFTSLKGRSYLKQAVIAVACCKWGDLKTFQQHQAVVQQQDQARQSCNAKRRCMNPDMEWLCEETDYREREGEARDWIEHRKFQSTDGILHDHDDEDFTAEHECGWPPASGKDWEEELQKALLDAKAGAVREWLHCHRKDPWAQDEVPDSFQQFIQTDAQQAQQA